jgi:hypothetical protein
VERGGVNGRVRLGPEQEGDAVDRQVPVGDDGPIHHGATMQPAAMAHQGSFDQWNARGGDPRPDLSGALPQGVEHACEVVGVTRSEAGEQVLVEAAQVYGAGALQGSAPTVGERDEL